MKQLIFLSLFALSACSMNSPILPKEAPKPQNKVVLDKATQKGSASRYVCKDEKEIKVVRVKSGKKSKKVDTINLTFAGVTNKLNATLSQTGKSYTNIHWHWFEKSDSNTLLNSVGEILAEQCIEQSQISNK